MQADYTYKEQVLKNQDKKFVDPIDEQLPLDEIRKTLK